MRCSVPELNPTSQTARKKVKRTNPLKRATAGTEQEVFNTLTMGCCFSAALRINTGQDFSNKWIIFEGMGQKIGQIRHLEYKLNDKEKNTPKKLAEKLQLLDEARRGHVIL